MLYIHFRTEYKSVSKMESSSHVVTFDLQFYLVKVSNIKLCLTVPVKQGLIHYRDCGVIAVFAHIHALLSCQF